MEVTTKNESMRTIKSFYKIIIIIIINFFQIDFNLDLNSYQDTIKNQVINFTVDFEDDLQGLNDDLTDPVKSLGNKILSRRSSVVIHKTESNNENVEETFDQILKVNYY